MKLKKNSAEKAYGGIGILEYIWDDVENYYTKKANIQEHNLNVNEDDLFEPKVFTFRIKEEPVKKPKRVNLCGQRQHPMAIGENTISQQKQTRRELK
jgi:hypothetical protein